MLFKSIYDYDRRSIFTGMYRQRYCDPSPPRTSAYYYDHHDEEDDEEIGGQSASPYLSSCLSFSLFLITLTFLGFLIYALIQFNTDAVRDACPNLLVFMIVRTVAGMIFFASFITFIICNKDEPIMLSPSIIIGFFVFYFSAFCIAGGFIIPQSMIGNSNCVDNALHDSFFQIPLLGILGWMYVGLDGIFAIIFILVLISISTSCWSSQNANQSDTDEGAMDTMD